MPVPRCQTLNSFSGLVVASCCDRGDNGDTQGRLVEAQSMPHFLTPMWLSTLSLSQDMQPPAPAAIHTPPHTLHLRAPQFTARCLWQSRAPNELFMGHLSTLLAYYN